MRILYGLILLAFLLSGMPVAAQQAESVVHPDLSSREFAMQKRRSEFEERQRRKAEVFEYTQQKPRLRHDVRMMLGFGPRFEGWGVPEWDEKDWWNPANELLEAKYSDSFFGRHCFAALSVAYAYRVSRRIEIGATVSYTGYRNRLVQASDGERKTTHREHYLTVMPVVRLLWFDRPLVRLYSGIEGGPQLAIRRGFFEQSARRELRGAGQFTAAGITVGRKCFFNAELGIGCRGIVNLGVGWRIAAKTKQK